MEEEPGTDWGLASYIHLQSRLWPSHCPRIMNIFLTPRCQHTPRFPIIPLAAFLVPARAAAPQGFIHALSIFIHPAFVTYNTLSTLQILKLDVCASVHPSLPRGPKAKTLLQGLLLPDFAWNVKTPLDLAICLLLYLSCFLWSV